MQWVDITELLWTVWTTYIYHIYMHSASYAMQTWNPIALGSWSSVMPSVISRRSGTICDWVITRLKTTLPDGLATESLTAGGWLQGRSVRVPLLINVWTVGLVTLHRTASHWRFLVQLSDCALSAKLSSAWHILASVGKEVVDVAAVDCELGVSVTVVAVERQKCS